MKYYLILYNESRSTNLHLLLKFERVCVSNSIFIKVFLNFFILIDINAKNNTILKHIIEAKIQEQIIITIFFFK